MRQDPLEALREASEVVELRKALVTLQGQLVKAQAKREQVVGAVYEAAYAAAAARAEQPPVPAPKRDRRRGRDEIALLHLSDWQIGKNTESYNTEVAQERIRQMAGKVSRLVMIERADHPVREAHVMLGGDMSEGVTIFPGQRWEIEAGAFQQVFATADILEEFLRNMLRLFQRVTVWEAIGNHGVVGKRGDHPRQDSWDNFIYEVVRRSLKKATDRGRLTWHQNERWYQIVEVGAYRALLVHGDQIKSFGGNTPAFGIVRKVNSWASGVVEPFIDCWMGHFHVPLVIPLANGGRVFVSPSLESSNEYAREFMAAMGRPSQRLFFIDPEKGSVTSERLVWLD